MNNKFVLTKDGEIFQVDSSIVYASSPAQYIEVVTGKGIYTTDVEYVADTKEDIINYLHIKEEQRRIKILLENSSELAMTNIIELLILMIDKTLKESVDVGDNCSRLLNGRELFEALSCSLKAYKERIEDNERKGI